jgi:hypothetical protein
MSGEADIDQLVQLILKLPKMYRLVFMGDTRQLESIGKILFIKS